MTATQNQPAISFISTLVNSVRVTGETFLSGTGFMFQKDKKATRAENRALSANEIVAKNIETKNRIAELDGSGNESDKREEVLKEYVLGLEEMMFMTHHKVRQPVANILGIANLIDKYANSPAELKKMVGFMRQSATDLDAFTRELTAFISQLEQKGKNKSKK